MLNETSAQKAITSYFNKWLRKDKSIRMRLDKQDDEFQADGKFETDTILGDNAKIIVDNQREPRILPYNDNFDGEAA